MHKGTTNDVCHTSTAIHLVQVACIYSNSSLTACVSLVTSAIDATAYGDLCVCARTHKGVRAKKHE